jgi:hypothetical protein
MTPSAGARIGRPKAKKRWVGSVATKVRQSRIGAVRPRLSTPTKSTA